MACLSLALAINFRELLWASLGKRTPCWVLEQTELGGMEAGQQLPDCTRWQMGNRALDVQP